MSEKNLCKVIKIEENKLREIIEVLERTNWEYLPCCNHVEHYGVIREERTEKLCVERGCKHYIRTAPPN